MVNFTKPVSGECKRYKKYFLGKRDTHRHGDKREVNNQKENIGNFCHNGVKLQNGFT